MDEGGLDAITGIARSGWIERRSPEGSNAQSNEPTLFRSTSMT